MRFRAKGCAPNGVGRGVSDRYGWSDGDGGGEGGATRYPNYNSFRALPPRETYTQRTRQEVYEEPEAWKQ